MEFEYTFMNYCNVEIVLRREQNIQISNTGKSRRMYLVKLCSLPVELALTLAKKKAGN